MRDVFDFLFWWLVEPSDDGPHLVFQLGLLGMLVGVGLVLPLFFEGLLDRNVQRAGWQHVAKPRRLIALHTLAGALIGVASLWMIPRRWAPAFSARYAGLIVTPLLVAIVASTVAYLAGPKRAPNPRLVFWTWLALCLGFAVVRAAAP